MANLRLFIFPGACSRVSLTALEHIGCEYETALVNLLTGAQKSAEYQAINPRGKVPALLVDGQLLTENAAILLYLDSLYPEAGLLPWSEGELARARMLADLFWLSAVWHPYVRANRAPNRWTTGDVEPVRARGKELIQPCLEELEARLTGQPWWLGERWSILDNYFHWCYTTAESGEVSLAGFPHIADHRSRIDALPAYQRALARERATMEAASI